jgi:hypothetical protein
VAARLAVGHRRLGRSISRGVDFSFLEGFPHRRLDPRGLFFCDLVFDEVAGHLLEDAGAPKRHVELEFGEPEQGVSEQER